MKKVNLDKEKNAWLKDEDVLNDEQSKFKKHEKDILLDNVSPWLWL